ncbi:MAG: hypothetical protein LBN18_06290 [Dysgonamonadaceae bacterium]|jgi:hypothetical protein|nr:hypothetical protein [Dysgonamonadaceae bacterium]
MNKRHFLKHLLLLPLVIAAFGAIVMLLWNWVIPGIFGCAAINYWQALGLLALSRIFFGGFGRHWMKAGMRHHHHNPIREKWMKMTPEERKEFVKNRRHPFGHFGIQMHDFDPDCRRDFFHENETGKQE